MPIYCSCWYYIVLPGKLSQLLWVRKVEAWYSARWKLFSCHVLCIVWISLVRWAIDIVKATFVVLICKNLVSRSLKSVQRCYSTT